jgi:transposase InsO family protein
MATDVSLKLRRAAVVVNHKRILRLMHEDNLLCLRQRAFVPATTDSNHGWQVVANLTRGMILTGIDQLWVADITYIRMREEFAFLAVVLDAFSRRVVGWALEAHLQASLAIAALRTAIAARRPPPGSLIHHSDRGVQYACKDYTDLLAAHDIRPSMSRIGCPYDNAKAESFMKTLKQEEVDGRTYRDINEARAAIGTFLEDVYNRRRLHSALAYQSPAEFEVSLYSQEGMGIMITASRSLATARYRGRARSRLAPPRQAANRGLLRRAQSQPVPNLPCLTAGVQFIFLSFFFGRRATEVESRLLGDNAQDLLAFRIDQHDLALDPPNSSPLVCGISFAMVSGTGTSAIDAGTVAPTAARNPVGSGLFFCVFVTLS